MDYVTAARAMGLPTRRIIFRHVLPNAFAPVLVFIGLLTVLLGLLAAVMIGLARALERALGKRRDDPADRGPL